MKKTFTMSTRITAVIIGIVVCCCSLIQPAIVNAQNLKEVKLTVSFKNETLSAALLKLEVAAKLPFSYDKNALAKVKVADISFTQETLETILGKLLAGTGQFYEVLNKNIIIAKKPSASPNASAGQGPGILKGRIVEFETSQPLPGASVYIIELQKGMQSNSDGYYKFSNIPAGKYTLKITYVSYKTESVSVQVKAAKEETFDVKLQGANSLNEVIVSSVRKSRAAVAHTSERKVLEEVKQASSVVSAISSEQISKSADRNAAEAVQRVAGVTIADDKFVMVRGLNQRYNLTYLNDNIAPSTEVYSRAFALDLIPSRIIDRIMVYKSPSPENQADATGAVVKIYTKDATAVKHFDLELQIGTRPGTTFNRDFLSYKGGKLDFLGVDDGTRKLPSSVPAYDQLKVAQLSPAGYARTFNSTLTYRKQTALPNMQLTGNYYNSFKVWGKTLSSLTSVSYKNEAFKTDVYRQDGYKEVSYGTTDRITEEDRNLQTAQLNLLQNFTLRLRDSSTLSFKNFILQQGQNATLVRISHATSGTEEIENAFYNKDNILSFQQRFLYAGNVGGTHFYDHGKHKFQWNGGYTFSSQSTPDQRVIRLTAPSATAAVGNADLQWRARGAVGSLTSEAVIGMPLRLGIISRLWMRNSEGNYNGSADYTYKHKPWLSFRAGAFQQWKERRLFRRIYTVHEGDLDINNGGAGQTHYLDAQLVRFREQDLANVWSNAYLRDDYVGLKVADRTSGSDSYMGTEQNNSGYMAVNFTPLNRLFEVYGGVRYEYNRQKIGAAIPPGVVPGSINIPVYIDNPMTSWLPSVNASWRPSESVVVRAAYGKTVNRTEFREVAPYKELDFENNVEISGNPNLISAKVNNYDFRMEFYPRGNAKGEMISAGIFYKELTNPIERINSSLRSQAVFSSLSYQNAASATIKGVEIEISKKLDFIPGALFRSLSVIANASFIKSVAKNDTTNASSLAFTTDNRPLQGQAPYIINAGLYYDNAAWGTKISAIYNTTGTNIYAAGRGYRYSPFADGPEYRGSLIELPRHMLDLAISQRIIKSLQAKLSIQNLLDQKIRMVEDYNFSNKYEPLSSEKTLETANGKMVRDGDNIASSYRPGRYFVMNLSYSF